MTQQRSDAEIRADLAVSKPVPTCSCFAFGCKKCFDHTGRYRAWSQAEGRLAGDVPALVARAERAALQLRAVEAERDRHVHDGNGECDDCGLPWQRVGCVVRRRLDSALAAVALAGLSLQEEQPTHLVGAGGWRACDTAADWAGSDTTGVTCAECLATTTDVLQEEQE